MRTKRTNPKPLEYYLSLVYAVTVYREAEGGYVAVIKDLPGCMTQGETPDEFMSNIEDARRLWIETAYEFSDEIPLPSDMLVMPS
ncbi:MAG: type II toxin-antitoxin system HicB family antitoxin [Leptolyngbyaceae cyanobacterium SM1_3_5]|nr:type II toxin-antitoxin system HicB family antitoxin [Leptolyngbyaceae cyanobacterium SM1_3_5]